MSDGQRTDFIPVADLGHDAHGVGWTLPGGCRRVPYPGGWRQCNRRGRGIRHCHQRHPAPRHQLRRGRAHRYLRRCDRRRRDRQRAWPVAPRGEHRLLQRARRRPDPHRDSADGDARRGGRMADRPREVRDHDIRARRHSRAGAGGERLPRVGVPPRGTADDRGGPRGRGRNMAVHAGHLHARRATAAHGRAPRPGRPGSHLQAADRGRERGVPPRPGGGDTGGARQVLSRRHCRGDGRVLRRAGRPRHTAGPGRVLRQGRAAVQRAGSATTRSTRAGRGARAP